LNPPLKGVFNYPLLTAEIAEEIFFLTFPEKGESQKTPALRAVLRLQN
jgi:hypothetical protein